MRMHAGERSDRGVAMVTSSRRTHAHRGRIAVATALALLCAAPATLPASAMPTGGHGRSAGVTSPAARAGSTAPAPGTARDLFPADNMWHTRIEPPPKDPH